MSEKLKVTTFEDLQKYSQGVLVELPSFSESQPFVCRLKRPDLIDIVTNDIPNELMGVVYKLFQPDEEKKQEKEETPEEAFELSREVKEVFERIAKAAMLEPTYEDVKNAGMELTMLQLTEIYNYVNLGVEKLKFFRSEQEN